MRYLGGKSLLVNNIFDVVTRYTENVTSVLDIFAGSGAVSQFMKEKGLKIICNDSLYFSYVLLKGSVVLNRRPSFKNLGIDNPIEYLNNLTISNSNININDCFIYNNYSPNQSCVRMYFQPENALKIDLIRITIQNWFDQQLIDKKGYYYLLCSLLNAIPYVANITGVYAAYLKYWDIRTYNKLRLTPPQLYNNRLKNSGNNCDYTSMLRKRCDLLYADPPYNTREYLPNYHILETVARYDYPNIKGVTGMRDYASQKSDFCSAKTVESAFEQLISKSQCKYILISYNNEALLPTHRLSELCMDFAIPGSFRLFEYDYRRYKNKIPNNTSGLKEQLYLLKRR